MATDRVAYLFNNLFSGFLKELKLGGEPLRQAIKTHYKVIDKRSQEHIQAFSDTWCSKEDTIKAVLKGEWEGVQSLEVCKGIVKGDMPSSLTFTFYLLLILAWLFTHPDDALIETTVHLMATLQNGGSIQAEVKDILEDEVRELLLKAAEYAPISPAAEDDLFKGMENSKIANLAKEISKDIDLSGLNTSDPQEMVKGLLDFSGSNNILGNILQKVSSSLQTKMGNGELKKEDLLGEAMSMMSMFDKGGDSGSGGNPLASMMGQFANNPMFQQMMQSGMGARPQSAGTRRTDSKTKERLRKKLEERKKNME